MRPPRADRILGVLLGGAIGDALGAPTEFLTLDEIRRRHGPDGVTGFAPAYGVPAAVTDDTQMTLATVEGLLVAGRRSPGCRVGNEAVLDVRDAYLRWLHGQEESARRSPRPNARHIVAPSAAEDAVARAVADAPTIGGHRLLDLPAFRERRAPGRTCLDGLRDGRVGTRTVRLNDSKGCGGVMRVAPVAFAAEDPWTLGCDVAALTHGHPSGWIASGALALLLAELDRATDAVHPTDALRAAVDAARRRAGDDPEGDEVAAAIDHAVRTADRCVRGELPVCPETLERVGAGWVAEEALAVAVFVVLAEPDVRRALLLAANHSGDSDSTGSIVGQVLGTLHGLGALPPEWVRDVEGSAALLDVARAFADRFVDTPAERHR